MDIQKQIENIDTNRERVLALCDDMISHLKTGLSNNNIHIVMGITKKIGNILDELLEKIDKSTEKNTLKKNNVDHALKSKGRFEVTGSAPPYSYYNHQL